MRKGTQNYTGVIFGKVYKSAWHTSWCSAQVGMAHKLALVKKKHPALILEVSTGNIGVYYISHLFPGLTALVLKPSRKFSCLGKHS